MDIPDNVVTAIKPKKTINRPHWKDLCEEQSLQIIALQQEIERLRAGGADRVDLAKVKAESFAAGVAAASVHFQK